MRQLLNLFVLFLIVVISPASLEAGYQETIRLNDLANRAILEDDSNPNDNFVQIRSLNGTFETIRFELPTGELRIQMGDGDDRLEITYGLPTLQADLFIEGEDGDDTFISRGLITTGNVTQDDPYGDNVFDIFRGVIFGKVDVFDGSGFQTVRIGILNYVGDISVFSTDGGSRISFSDSAGITDISGNIAVHNEGYGRDSIHFLRTNILGNVTLELGHGEAFAQTGRVSVDGSFSLHVDSGELGSILPFDRIGGDLTLRCDEGETRHSIGATEIGGSIFVRNGLGFDTLDLGSPNLNLVQIDNGNGGSRTQIDGVRTNGSPDEVRIQTLRVTNGDGSNELTIGERYDHIPQIQLPIYVGDANVVNGNGNTTVGLSTTASVGSLRVATGDGYDTLRMKGATITEETIFMPGDGGSSTTITDSELGGLVDIQPGDDADIVILCDSVFPGTANIHTWGGDDLVVIANSLFTSELVVSGGSGFDTLEYDGAFDGTLEYIIDFELEYDQIFTSCVD